MADPVQFKVRRDGMFWVIDHPELSALNVRFPQDEVSSLDQIRAYLHVPVEELYPGKYALDWPLPKLKQEVFARIDALTDEHFLRGFKYKGVTLSLSLEALNRYGGMKQIAHRLPYPLPLNSLDDTDVCLLMDAADTDEMATQAGLAVLYVVGAGTMEKQRVREMQTEAEVLAFVDQRTLAPAPPAPLPQEPEPPSEP